MTQEITHRAATTLQSTPFEIVTPLSSRTLFWRARYLRQSPNLYHLPFLFWLVDIVRPRGFVELGLTDGVAYFAICQALDKLDFDARCQGISLVSADAGAESQQIAQDLSTYNETQYAEFSRLSGPLVADGKTLKQAAHGFADRSIDMLHVNLEVDQDVITSLNNDWTRKLSDRSVVVFSASRTRFASEAARDFLDGITARYPSVTLEVGDGMVAVLFGSKQRDDRLTKLAELKLGMSGFTEVHQVFGRLGASSHFEWASAEERTRSAAAQKRASEAEAALGQEKAQAEEQEQALETLRSAYDERSRQAATFQGQIFDLQKAEEAHAAERAQGQARLDSQNTRVEALMREAEANRATVVRAEQEAQEFRATHEAEKSGLQAQVSDLTARIATLTVRLEEDRQEIEDSRLRLKDAKSEAKELRELMIAWEARAKEAERYNEELLQSSSWKMTAPARAVLGSFRRRPPTDASS